VDRWAAQVVIFELDKQHLLFVHILLSAVCSSLDILDVLLLHHNNHHIQSLDCLLGVRGQHYVFFSQYLCQIQQPQTQKG